MSRSRAWCFTINNPTEEEWTLARNIECNYIILGDEIGENETPHIQGYIEFKDAKTRSSVQNKLGKRGHFEVRLGTPVQASDYCKKSGKFEERGQISQQGKRTDLEQVVELVKEGGVKAVIENRPDMFIKFGRNIERLAELSMKPRDSKPNVIWLYGKKGTGKTRTAADVEGEYYIWTQTKWWNGYHQQQRIIIDDYAFDGTENSFRYLLRLLDRYAIQVETKGGMLPLNSPEIYITCEFHPSHWFEVGRWPWINSTNTLDQVLRRIDTIRELTEEEAYVNV